jgi:hypothetical protein
MIRGQGSPRLVTNGRNARYTGRRGGTAMTQDQDECFIFEEGAEQPEVGTKVLYDMGRYSSRPHINRPFDDVLHVLQGAGWKVVGTGCDEGHTRIYQLQRHSRPGRDVDDTLDRLQRP